MLNIEEYRVTPLRTHGIGREGVRWSTTIEESRWSTPIADVNEDGDGGELRIEFRADLLNVRCFRDAVTAWVDSIAPSRHKCVDSIGAWVYHQHGTPLGELLALFFAEDLPTPTRPVDADQLDRVLHNVFLGLSRGAQMIHSLASRVGGCDWPLRHAQQILTSWKNEGMLDVDDWPALQELGRHHGVWGVYDLDEGLDKITVLIPTVDYDVDHVVPHPKAVVFYHRKPTFGEPDDL